MKPALISVIGKKGSGKSGVIERLISVLTRRGLRVGVVKRLRRDDIEIDEPGKDTFRYRSEGARRVVLAGRRRLALFANLEEELAPEKLLGYFEDFDLVIFEGYFQKELPSIEIQPGISPEEVERLAEQLAASCLESVGARP